MGSPKNRWRKDIGTQMNPVSFPLADGAVSDTPVAVLSSTAGVVKVIDRIYFTYPNDVVTWDITIAIQGTTELAATPRTILTIDDAGASGVTEPRIVFTYDIGNPPTNYYYGYWDLINTALGPVGDSLTVTGNDATAANNYDSTAVGDGTITFHYRQIDSSVW